MFKVNLRDGRTLCYDLCTDEGVAQWQDALGTPGFQRQITGVSVQQDRWAHTLPLPGRFRSVEFDAECLRTNGKIVGVVVTCNADDVIITLTVYTSGVSRADIRRREWRQRFDPSR